MQLGSPPNLLYRRKRQRLLLRYGQRERVQRIEWLHLGDQLSLQVATSRAEHANREGRLDPAHLRYALPTTQTSLEALRAVGEIAHVKRSLELYRAQPAFEAPEDFSARLREVSECLGQPKGHPPTQHSLT